MATILSFPYSVHPSPYSVISSRRKRAESEWTFAPPFRLAQEISRAQILEYPFEGRSLDILIAFKQCNYSSTHQSSIDRERILSDSRLSVTKGGEESSHSVELRPLFVRLLHDDKLYAHLHFDLPDSLGEGECYSSLLLGEHGRYYVGDFRILPLEVVSTRVSVDHALRALSLKATGVSPNQKYEIAFTEGSLQGVVDRSPTVEIKGASAAGILESFYSPRSPRPRIVEARITCVEGRKEVSRKSLILA